MITKIRRYILERYSKLEESYDFKFHTTHIPKNSAYDTRNYFRSNIHPDVTSTIIRNKDHHLLDLIKDATELGYKYQIAKDNLTNQEEDKAYKFDLEYDLKLVNSEVKSTLIDRLETWKSAVDMQEKDIKHYLNLPKGEFINARSGMIDTTSEWTSPDQHIIALNVLASEINYPHILPFNSTSNEIDKFANNLISIIRQNPTVKSYRDITDIIGKHIGEIARKDFLAGRGYSPEKWKSRTKISQQVDSTIDRLKHSRSISDDITSINLAINLVHNTGNMTDWFHLDPNDLTKISNMDTHHLETQVMLRK
jgi:hypothetical protein